MLEKAELIPLLEPSSLIARVKVKLSKQWPPNACILKRLLVNRQYRFIYCPINKNASTSMMAALLELGKQNTDKNLAGLTSKEIRLYVVLNYSLANYTYTEATHLIQSDYFKFTIVRNPWARLVSTYANYFVRLPAEKHIFSDIAKSAALHIYGDSSFLNYVDSITFDQFVRYVAVTEDAELDIHCRPQSYFLGSFSYDFAAKMENLDQDLTLIEEKLNLPLKIKRFNKTAYSESQENSEPYYTFTPAEIRALKSKVPNYKMFYNSELSELVRQRYAADIERFDYSFLT